MLGVCVCILSQCVAVIVAVSVIVLSGRWSCCGEFCLAFLDVDAELLGECLESLELFPGAHACGLISLFEELERVLANVVDAFAQLCELCESGVLGVVGVETGVGGGGHGHLRERRAGANASAAHHDHAGICAHVHGGVCIQHVVLLLLMLRREMWRALHDG
jgi:hypothetical protein